jgi:hypothetical protein
LRHFFGRNVMNRRVLTVAPLAFILMFGIPATAEPILITSGSIELSGLPFEPRTAHVNLVSLTGFEYRRVGFAYEFPECALADCQPGQTLDVGFLVSFLLDDPPMLLVDSTVRLPARSGANETTIVAPFSMDGLLLYPQDPGRASDPVVGGGTATFFLRPPFPCSGCETLPGFSTAWEIGSAMFEFEPVAVPEPHLGTLLLLATGAAAARRSRRTSRALPVAKANRRRAVLRKNSIFGPTRSASGRTEC